MTGQMVKSVFEKFSKCQGRKILITTLYKFYAHISFLKNAIVTIQCEKGKLSHLL